MSRRSRSSLVGWRSLLLAHKPAAACSAVAARRRMSRIRLAGQPACAAYTCTPTYLYVRLVLDGGVPLQHATQADDEDYY